MNVGIVWTTTRDDIWKCSRVKVLGGEVEYCKSNFNLRDMAGQVMSSPNKLNKVFNQVYKIYLLPYIGVTCSLESKWKSDPYL